MQTYDLNKSLRARLIAAHVDTATNSAVSQLAHDFSKPVIRESGETLLESVAGMLALIALGVCAVAFGAWLIIP